MSRISASEGSKTSGGGSGNVTGEPPTTVNAIAIWGNALGTLLENSIPTVQAGGAILAQAFLGDRQIVEDVVVPNHYTMIQTEIYLISGDLTLEGDAQLLLL